MRIMHREDQEQREHDVLAPDVSFSDESEGRDRSAEPDILRNDYQRDRDKILHTKSFRRLSHKTQVFLAAEGDHFRTRLTHTLEVAQIARTIARHMGIPADDPRVEGLYRHNEQSLRVVEVIENSGRGLNLMSEVCDGILCHTGSVRAETMEGHIVAAADRIAYVNHDIDDAIRAGLLRESDLPESTHRVLGQDRSARIETLEQVPGEYRAISSGDTLRAVTDFVAGMNDRYASRVYQELFIPQSWKAALARE